MAARDSIKCALGMAETDPSKVLDVAFGSVKLATPGQILTKAETTTQPTINFGGPPHGQYLVICLDLDPPFTSMPFMGPILHWMQSDLKSSQAAHGSASSLTPPATDVPAVASYYPPGPPPISAAHRYLFLLYEQPADFDYKKFQHPDGDMGMWPRARWNLENFEKDANLGPVVATNFVRV